MTTQQQFERLNQLAATLNEINTIFNLAMRQCEDAVFNQLADLRNHEQEDEVTDRMTIVASTSRNATDVVPA